MGKDPLGSFLALHGSECYECKKIRVISFTSPVEVIYLPNFIQLLILEVDVLSFKFLECFNFIYDLSIERVDSSFLPGLHCLMNLMNFRLFCSIKDIQLFKHFCLNIGVFAESDVNNFPGLFNLDPLKELDFARVQSFLLEGRSQMVLYVIPELALKH
jgi:hypothetical protein